MVRAADWLGVLAGTSRALLLFPDLPVGFDAGSIPTTTPLYIIEEARSIIYISKLSLEMQRGYHDAHANLGKKQN